MRMLTAYCLNIPL